jgi:hypothetical protein
MEVLQPYANHNGGKLTFGPDHFLYIGFGDGGSGGDPEENGQDRSTILGSLIRIDVDTSTATRNYGIPSDNPLVGADCGPEGCREEIYAYGLRNPWRFSFDPANGRLWLADVGQSSYEEVNVIEKGGNYGWDVMEGTHCYEPSSGCDQTGLTLPVWEYSHSVGGSITGGVVYRGSEIDELVGQYLVADFVDNKAWALQYDGEEVTGDQKLFDIPNVAAFGTDRSGEVYMCSFNGSIYKIVDKSLETPDQPVVIKPDSGQVLTDTSVDFVVENQTDPESDTLEFQFEVYEDAELNSIFTGDQILQNNSDDQTTWNPSISFKDNQRYFWIVRAYNGYAYGEWSDTLSFVVNSGNDAPQAFNLTKPINKKVVSDLRPKFQWEEAVDPDPLDTVMYTVQIDGPEEEIIKVNADTSTSHMLSDKLEDNSQYFWNVEATDELGASASSDTLMFWVNTKEFRRQATEIKSRVIGRVKEALLEQGINLPGDIKEIKLYGSQDTLQVSIREKP